MISNKKQIWLTKIDYVDEFSKHYEEAVLIIYYKGILD